MKRNIKSVLNRVKLVVFITLLPLCGCADVSAFNWLTGEPMKEVTKAPRLVKVPVRSENEAWPNLADIPDKRPVFSTVIAREDDSAYLITDRYQADANSARIRAIEVPYNDQMNAVQPVIEPQAPQTQDASQVLEYEVKQDVKKQDNMPKRLIKPFSALRR